MFLCVPSRVPQCVCVGGGTTLWRATTVLPSLPLEEAWRPGHPGPGRVAPPVRPRRVSWVLTGSLSLLCVRRGAVLHPVRVQREQPEVD